MFLAIVFIKILVLYVWFLIYLFFRFTSESVTKSSHKLSLVHIFIKISVELRGQRQMWFYITAVFISQFFLLLLSLFG